MASRVIQVDNARAMPICDVRTSICLTVVLVYYKDQWRSQYGANGATAPPDCQGPLLEIRANPGIRLYFYSGEGGWQANGFTPVTED